MSTTISTKISLTEIGIKLFCQNHSKIGIFSLSFFELFKNLSATNKEEDKCGTLDEWSTQNIIKQ